MQPLPEALHSAAASRALDRLAQEELKLAPGALMERAGEAAYGVLRHRYPRARRIAVVCGPGNNGGDGYVLARWLYDTGLEPRVLALAEPKPATDAARARAALLATGVAVVPFSPETLNDCELIVDALFGTGLERAVDGAPRAAIEAMNASRLPVLALDLPSGLHADAGGVLGAAVRAEATVSFITLKPGQFTGLGPDHCGAISYHDLGVPATLRARGHSLALRITIEAMRGLLRRRPRAFHKGEAGRVLVIGGQPGMAGAARLTGEAACRAGAGLVRVLTHPQHAAYLSAARPELLTAAPVCDAEARGFLMEADIAAIGPGLGREEWGRGRWRAALDSGRPLVVDADALTLLAADPIERPDWVLTPHPGEAARLLGRTAAEVQTDRYAAARAIAARYGGVCVLKGCGTLVAGGDHEPVAVCDRGHPGMATGGTGDVLTGVIAALRGQGLAPFDAARLGVHVHAAAGEAVAARQGEIGLLASDLLAEIPRALNALVA